MRGLKIDPKDIQWKKNLKKNLLNNRQLENTGFMFLSALTKNEYPENDMLKLRAIKDEKLMFECDLRSNFINQIQNTKKGCLTVYFALSKEKMKFKGNFDILDYKQKKEEEKEDYIQIWNDELDKNEKRKYKEANPDKIKIEPEDILRFNNPDLDDLSQNFGVLRFYPISGNIQLILLVEHTVYTLPQVIADSRNPSFETEFKPYKTSRKYLHTKVDGLDWKIEEINPW